MGLELRIIFLFLLFITGLLYVLGRGPTLGFNDFREIILDFLLVPAAVGTVAIFFFILTRTDPLPLLREGSYQLSFQHNVSFEQAIPPNLRDNLAVVSVDREDTDGDGFKEWVVFYQFDLQSGNSPIQAVIYDSDRGNPPVLFPYQLRAPDRDYLSENAGSLEFRFEQVVEQPNGPNREDLQEILISDNRQLGIFRFEQNSEVWDFPRDAPPRYKAVGFFRGTGGVKFEPETKRVTVVDRDRFERSQLAVRSIYALNPNTNSYWDDIAPLGAEPEANPALVAPIISTIDFFSAPAPPENIYSTAFPEKIVLAFYAATCGVADDTLCRNFGADWDVARFLAGDALLEYNNNNAAYFGLSSFNRMRNISVSNLRYFPSLESDADLLPTGSGRDIVTGEQAQFNIVEISFIPDTPTLETAWYEMRLINGEWKIVQQIEAPLIVEPPTEIPAP